MTVYTCKECGAPANLENNPVTREVSVARTCQCEGAIIADMRATARGESSFAASKVE